MNTSISGFILAGGESRRMGRDKAQLTLDGERFVDRIAAQLSMAASSVTIVGKTSQDQTTLRCVADVYPNWGALGGVHAALAACEVEWCLVVACDFPFVTHLLFERLANLNGTYDAVAPIQADGIPQPLCALYRVDPCLALAARLIKSGERKPIALLQSVRTRWVAFSELEDLPGAQRFFDNINTREDYERVLEKGTPKDGAT